MVTSRERSPEDRTSPDQQLVALGRATGELLHDLGGTLSVLCGRIALLADESLVGRDRRSELARIEGEALELQTMVTDILAELRGNTQPPEATVPVLAALDEVMNRWVRGAPTLEATLRSSLPGEVEIRGPRTFFTRGVGNLLRNAARHARRRIEIRVDRQGDRGISLQIDDDGAGVAEGLRERIFDPLVAGPECGVGFGLSFTRWGIERLGGSIVLAPEPAELGGASFRIYLPMAPLSKGWELREHPSTPYRGDEPTPGRNSLLQGVRVTLVDDDPAIRKTFAKLLRLQGAKTTEVDPLLWNSPSEGAEEVIRSRPDVVLIDLDLIRCSGLELHTALTHRSPVTGAQVLFLTGGNPSSNRLPRPVLSKLEELQTLVLRVRLLVDSTAPPP